MNNDFTADERSAHAYLNRDGVPVLCSRSEWLQWWEREGDRCQIKYDRIDDWEIETRFQGVSVALDGVGLDGPPLFWEVSFYNPGFSTESQRFGTREAALAFHSAVIEKIMTEELGEDQFNEPL
jgi:hypothetical protein